MNKMKRLLIYLAMLAPIPPTSAAGIAPRDVQHFVDKREGCDHMRGEIPDPSDKQSMKALNREIRKLCTGTDKELQKLKRKYAANPAIMQILNEYEPDIEALDAQLSKNMRTSEK
jgi:hypothetical protein